MPEAMQAAEAKKKESGIKILGGGCAKCNALEAETEEALRELGMDATIDHVKDYEKIDVKRTGSFCDCGGGVCFRRHSGCGGAGEPDPEPSR